MTICVSLAVKKQIPKSVKFKFLVSGIVREERHTLTGGFWQRVNFQ